MLQVTAVPLHTEYRLWMRFSDGAEGIVDLGPELHGPIFVPVRDPSLFSRVSISTDSRTIYWPNGADFAPEFLRELLRVGATA
ncbi:MAG: DUF2442 domain-containing protein [Phycisphaerae bacterium]|nr:DUF2442 domain-containing protein [Gemmatimonadaceae bacterium]